MLGPGGTDAPCFFLGQDYLWDSEEQHCEWTAQLICSSLLYGTRLPLGFQGTTQKFDCIADLLLPSIWDETAFLTMRIKTENLSILNPLFKFSLCRSPRVNITNIMLIPVPEAVLSHNEGRSRSAVQSILCGTPRCNDQYIKEEQISCSLHSLGCLSLLLALLTERTVLAGC